MLRVGGCFVGSVLKVRLSFDRGTIGLLTGCRFYGLRVQPTE